jgi:sugar lactone lactonase YvrE
MPSSTILPSTSSRVLWIALLCFGCDNGSAASGGGTAWTDGEETGGVTGGDDVTEVVHAMDGVDVTTLAGSDAAGNADGSPASFNNPANLIRDPSGRLIVADFDNGRTRTVAMNGAVGTLTKQAGFARPFGLVFTDNGMIVAQTDFNDQGDNGGDEGGVLWLVDPQNGNAVVLATAVGRPRGLARLPDGRIVMADIVRHDVRIFDPSTSAITPLAGVAGSPGYVDGAGERARFERPYGCVVLDSGDVLVADQSNHAIRRVAADGTVSTFAGKGSPGMVDGDLADARFNLPQDLALDASGTIYVTDVGNHRIRRITPGRTVETVAGDGKAGFQDGSGKEARFFGQEGIDVEPDGSVIYVADGTNGEVEPYHRIRKIEMP